MRLAAKRPLFLLFVQGFLTHKLEKTILILILKFNQYLNSLCHKGGSYKGCIFISLLSEATPSNIRVNLTGNRRQDSLK